MQPGEKSSALPYRALAALTIAVASSPAWAVPLVADGKLDSSDGSIYQLGYHIGFLDDKNQSIGGGRLFFGINSADQSQFLYFQLPESYVDNTYGVNAASDWGKKGHSFNNLLGSDRWGVTDKKTKVGGFGWNGNAVTFDYIAGVCGTKSCGKKDKATGYRSGGVGNTLNDGATSKNEGAVIAGSAADILEIATSLEYNLTLVDPSAIVDSSLSSAWIKEVGYEIQFAAGTFDAADWLDPTKAFDLITLGVVHASPSKVGYTHYETPECIVGCTPPTLPPARVPEPSTLFLMGGGLLALVRLSGNRKPRK